MERVSCYLEEQDEAVSWRQLRTAVGGREEYLRVAFAHLLDEGYVGEEVGPRKARLITSNRPFRRTTGADRSLDEGRRSNCEVPDSTGAHEKRLNGAGNSTGAHRRPTGAESRSRLTGARPYRGRSGRRS